MNPKREFKGKARAFQIFKSLRNCCLSVICAFSLLTVTASAVSAETTAAQQQTVKISGTVTDTSGETLIGVSVVEKGTSNGTVTDLNGAFTLNVAPNAAIEVNYIGYLPALFRVTADKSVYDVFMQTDLKSLEEVVVIGYGVQKKKLVTGATVQVTGENLQKMSTTSPFTALQSQTPGVTIRQNNGQPGAGFIMHIRGLGTNGEARPLYVVDGVATGHEALDHMSSSDIETIDILKDAASSAIYGARAANGVVLITTKQGKSGKVTLSYDGWYGSQYMSKKPDLLNAKEYILVQNELRYNSSLPAYDWENRLPFGMYDDIMSGRWTGSDWVDAFYNKGAATQQHAFNLTGGNEFSKFSMGYSWASHDGIFGEAAQSNYTRNTFRINSDHVLLKVKDFEAIKIGQTLNYTYRTQNGIQQGDMYWNDFTGVMRAYPLMPIYNAEGGYYDQNDKDRDGWVFDGNFGNPIGMTVKSSRGMNMTKNHALNASAYLQIQPIKNLIFRSQFGYQMSGGAYRDFSDLYYFHNGQGGRRNVEEMSQSAWLGYSWKLDNTLSYSFSQNNHNVLLQVGQGLEQSGTGDNVNGWKQYSNYAGLGWDYAWLDNFIPTEFSHLRTGGSPWEEWALSSFWGRVMYNYKETYMATVIMRADGSSKFSRGNRWGYFPSVSAGWILTNESFLEGAAGVLDFLKLSAGWGKNGNQDIDAFQYLAQYEFPATALYYFGDGKKDTPSTGAVAKALPNPNITWESTTMLDLGFESRFLNNRLGLGINYYIKDTEGWLLEAPISGTWGFNAPTVNGGSVQNKGVEWSLNWNDRVNDFLYSINLNGSYNVNEVKEIANTEGVIHGSSNILAQGTGELYRLQVGYPMGIFYGWKADGIFQNWDDVNRYKNADGELIQPDAVPGDVRFRDISGPDKVPDGKIDENDKTKIGCGWPVTQMGFQISLGYKGFDFSVAAAGAFGFDIAKSYRSFADSDLQNYTTQVFDRWVGEGTSNKWPRLTTGNHLNYQYVSDIFLEKGDYVKIQNITLGYDFKKLFNQLPLGQCRFYLTGQNLFTFTGYTGMDPEVGFSGNTDHKWMSGVDVGYYPSAKTFLCGVQVTF